MAAVGIFDGSWVLRWVMGLGSWVLRPTLGHGSWVVGLGGLRVGSKETFVARASLPAEFREHPALE